MRKITTLFLLYLGISTLGMGGVYYGFKTIRDSPPLPTVELLLVSVALIGSTLLLSLGTLALGRLFYLMDRRN